MIDDDDEERQIREENRVDAKAAINKPWAVERHDFSGGSIAYELWSDDGHHRICSISDSDNPTAKRDAEHLAKLHNDSIAAPLSFIDVVFDGPPGPTAGRFVEVEDQNQKSISFGDWIERGKYWVLRIPILQRHEGMNERQAQAEHELLIQTMLLLKDVLPELESEAEQRETSGNDEYSKGIRALADRVRKIVEAS